MNTALLLIDFVNPLDHPGGARLAPRALRAARNTLLLRARRSMRAVHAIYANDNFGRWKSDFRQVIEQCEKTPQGRALVSMIRPRTDDLFVLKPRHSAFFSTPLQPLLEHLRISRLVLTGVAADICVLFTANDAFLRGYPLWIPADCIASETAAIERQTVRYFERVLRADVRPIARRAK